MDRHINPCYMECRSSSSPCEEGTDYGWIHYSIMLQGQPLSAGDGLSPGQDGAGRAAAVELHIESAG